MGVFNNLIKGIKKLSKNGFSMQLRILTLFLTSFFTLILIIFILLFATGVFKSAEREQYQLSENELKYLTNTFVEDTNVIATESILFSNTVSDKIEQVTKNYGSLPSTIVTNKNFLKENEKETEEISLRNDIINEIMTPAISSLRLTKASSCFVILDATIDPAKEHADTSRTSLFLLNTNASASLSTTGSYMYVKGPLSVIYNYDNYLNVAPQWTLEYDIANEPEYRDIIDNYSHEEIKNAYRWYFVTSPYTSTNESLRCAAPIVTSDGYVIGVAGFEIAPSLFKYRYTSEQYDTTISLISKKINNEIILNHSLCNLLTYDDSTQMSKTKSSHLFDHYTIGNERLIGKSMTLNLYPADSKYATDTWEFFLLYQEATMTKAIRSTNLTIIAVLSIILVIFLVIAVFLSRWIVNPLKKAIISIKSEENTYQAVNVPEIDDLLSFLANQDKMKGKKNTLDNSPSQNQLFLEFKQNVKTLSKAERLVFNLYLEGYSAQEISEKLYLSMNTIKTHNKRIYMKLNISSRKELMLYVQMMNAEKESDKQ